MLKQKKYLGDFEKKYLSREVNGIVIIVWLLSPILESETVVSYLLIILTKDDIITYHVTLFARSKCCTCLKLCVWC